MCGVGKDGLGNIVKGRRVAEKEKNRAVKGGEMDGTGGRLASSWTFPTHLKTEWLNGNTNLGPGRRCRYSFVADLVIMFLVLPVESVFHLK